MGLPWIWLHSCMGNRYELILPVFARGDVNRWLIIGLTCSHSTCVSVRYRMCNVSSICAFLSARLAPVRHACTSDLCLPISAPPRRACARLRLPVRRRHLRLSGCRFEPSVPVWFASPARVCIDSAYARVRRLIASASAARAICAARNGLSALRARACMPTDPVAGVCLFVYMTRRPWLLQP